MKGLVFTIFTPISGRASAVCNKVDKPCTVAHSACVDGICVCVDGYVLTHDFLCSQRLSGATEDAKGVPFGIIFGILAAAAAVGALAFFGYRYKKNKAAKAELKKKGEVQLSELHKLSADVETIEEYETMYSEETSHGETLTSTTAEHTEHTDG